MSGTVGAALQWAAEQLRAAGIEAPAREARLLLALALDADGPLLPDRDGPMPPSAFKSLVRRRAGREPLALIRGTQGFWTLDLAVSPATLVPRPDSETLVRGVLAARPDRGAPLRVLDFGTGTGALLLAVLSEYPASWGLGVDSSAAAARLAAANARRTGLAARAAFAVAHWGRSLGGAFDVILSNPPYVESAAIARLMPEVRDHEPRMALDGGAAGLDAYAALLPDARRLLAPEGLAVLELGAGQAAAVTALAESEGLGAVALHQDYAGIARALVLRPRTG